DDGDVGGQAARDPPADGVLPARRARQFGQRLQEGHQRMLRAGAAGWLGGQDGTPLLGRLRRAGGLGVPMSAAANTTDRPPRWGRSATPGATFGLYGTDFGPLGDL